jgi:VCBS repeat-containing protein
MGIPLRTIAGIGAAAALLVGGLAGSAAAVDGVPLHRGDIVIADGAALRIVDPATGERSDLHGGASGSLFQDIEGLAIDASGDVVVAEGPASPRISRLDAETGVVTTVSSGGLLSQPWDIAIEADGNLVVADAGPSLAQDARVIRIDPTTGTQSLIAHGAPMRNPFGIAVEAGGTLLVATDDISPGVIRIDPTTGAQTPLATGATHSADIALEADGQILITSLAGGVNNRIVRVNPLTGAQSTLASGGSLIFSLALDVEESGGIVVADNDLGGHTRIFRIDPVSGAQTLVSPASGRSKALAVVRAIAPLVAGADDLATDEDQPLAVDAPGLLANDVDAEDDPLEASLVSGPSHGQLTLSADGSFTYTPDPDYFGPDSFVYQATDGTHADEATVSLAVRSVEDVPAADDDSYSTDEDQPLVVGEPGVLGNDTDLQGDALTATVATGPAHGQLSLADDGSFTYSPDGDYFGPDAFTYEASDGTNADTATVSLMVRPVDDVPAAADDSYPATEDQQLVVDAPGLLANDGADADGDARQVEIVSTPDHAQSFDPQPDGSFTYTPSQDFAGTDSFTYRILAGPGQSNVATVTIEVEGDDEAPVAQDDAYPAIQAVSLDVPAPGLLENDTDPDHAERIAQLVDPPALGEVSWGADGSFSYLSAIDGIDHFTYRACYDNPPEIGGSRCSDPATVTITVRPNHPPVAVDDAYTTPQGAALGINYRGPGGLLANDGDPDGDDLGLTFDGGAPTVAHGTIVQQPGAPDLVYTPAPGFSGQDSFTYRATDGGLTSNLATVRITVTPAPPVNAVSIGDAQVAEGDTGAPALKFTLSRTGPTSQAATIRWHTVDGTATAGQDYTAVAAGQTKIPAGASTATVTVKAIGDRLDEGDETFHVVLDSSTGAPIGDGDGLGTITDDDPPTLTIDNDSVAEGNRGPKRQTFTVHLSKKWNKAVTAHWETQNGSATAGSDYVAAAGTVTIAVGARTAVIEVTVNGDKTAEPEETYRVALSAPTEATIGDAEAIGTIRNDD